MTMGRIDLCTNRILLQAGPHSLSVCTTCSRNQYSPTDAGSQRSRTGTPSNVCIRAHIHSMQRLKGSACMQEQVWSMHAAQWRHATAFPIH